MNKALDLFCGCGGATFGLKSAGFKVVGALDINQLALDTYRINHKNVSLKGDIKSVDPLIWMRELSLKRGELDLLSGCPPCQGFSTLRTRNGSLRNRDSRNHLLNDMMNFVGVFFPKFVMMENVPALKDKAVFNNAISKLKKLGYKIKYEIFNALDYGVPQNRLRLILIGSRDLDVEFAKPQKKRRTVRDAIGKINQSKFISDPLHNNFLMNHSELIRKRISAIPKNGGSRISLPSELTLKCHSNTTGYSDVYGRMNWDKPSPTITSGCYNPSKGRFLHPIEDRAITLREASLIQTFPAKFRVPDHANKQQIALMIGNALPPNLMKAHARAIYLSLQSKTQSAGQLSRV